MSLPPFAATVAARGASARPTEVTCGRFRWDVVCSGFGSGVVWVGIFDGEFYAPGFVNFFDLHGYLVSFVKNIRNLAYPERRDFRNVHHSFSMSAGPQRHKGPKIGYFHDF